MPDDTPNIKKQLIDALRLRYSAQMFEAKATLDVYLNNPAGIGEHPQVVDEAAKQLEKYDDAASHLATLIELYGIDADDGNIFLSDDDD